MRIRWTGISALLAVAAFVLGAAITGEGQAPPAAGQAAAPAAGRQAQAPRPAAAPVGGRTEDGKPNLNGIWQSLTSANWDIEAHNAEAGPHPEIMGAWGSEPPGMGIVEGGSIPY